MPWPAFLHRAAFHLLVGFAGILIALAIGVVGYHTIAQLPWIDSFLNASMILGGMGPVDTLKTTGAKLFAGLYALFSGLMFIALLGIVLAPWAHRVLHKFHMDEDEGGATNASGREEK